MYTPTVRPTGSVPGSPPSSDLSRWSWQARNPFYWDMLPQTPPSLHSCPAVPPLLPGSFPPPQSFSPGQAAPLVSPLLRDPPARLYRSSHPDSLPLLSSPAFPQKTELYKYPGIPPQGLLRPRSKGSAALPAAFAWNISSLSSSGSLLIGTPLYNTPPPGGNLRYS